MKKKSIWLKLIFVVILLLIIWYTVKDSMGDILEQIRMATWQVLLATGIATVLYHLVEAGITCSLARQYNPQFRYRNAVYCAFCCSFYRLSTLGSGQGLAAVLYLGKHGVGYSESTGLYMIQYMLHKVCIAIFSVVFFLANWGVMTGNYRGYAGYLIAAYGLTALIAAGLIIFAVSEKSHRLILFVGKKLNRRHRLDGALQKLQESCSIMETSTRKLLTDWKLIVGTILKSLLKFVFWYSIPFLILMGTHQITLLDSLSVTSLSVMTAAVIPTPAGLGSLEVVMTGLFRKLVNFEQAAAITVLYRVFTFILPAVLGGCMIFVSKVYSRFLASRFCE